MFQLLIIFLIGCAEPEGDPIWAMNWATITPAEDNTASGVQIWQLYQEGWEKRYKEDYYVCSIAQELEATKIDCPETGIPGCVAFYSLTLEIFESDCAEKYTIDPGFNGPLKAGIGLLPDDLKKDAPYDQDVLGWFIFDQEILEHGYAYAEALDQGTQPPPGWVPGERYIWWPAYAWKL